MDLKIVELEPTELEFGGIGHFTDPKVGLREAGPFDIRFGGAQLQEVRIAIVGTAEMNLKATQWLERCKKDIPTAMKNIKQYPDYDGFEAIFRAKLQTSNLWSHEISEDHLTKALAIGDNYARFEAVLELYSEGILKISQLENNKPNLILCALPENILDSCGKVEKKLTKAEKATAKKAVASIKGGIQLSIFDDPVEDTVEDLLYRDFRRALKAKAIVAKIPIQLGRDNLFVDSTTNQDAATRAWNLTVSMYYKAGGIPWRLKNDNIETCYVGITFHHLRTTSRQVVKSCLAQAFSSEGEGFALRGGDVEQEFSGRRNNRTVHLSENQAYRLGLQIIEEYANRTGLNPQRIVMHKSSVFDPVEEIGFRSAFNSIPIVELINILPTSFILLKHSKYPANRGTLCTVNDSNFYLFNTGFIKELSTYPGPHIPRSVEIRSNEYFDVEKSSADILALARMNWNTSSITGGSPVTLSFSRQVGGIMSELNVKNIQNLPTSFRYYI